MASSTRPATAGATAGNTLLLRLGLGVFLTLNIMVFSWLFYSQEWFGDVARAEGLYAGFADLFSYLTLFLCTGVLVLLGLPLLSDALAQLAAGHITAPLLISLGVFSAYILSAVHTIQGAGSLYYDTAAVILVIVTLGSYLEAGAKHRAASSANELLARLPDQVRLKRKGRRLELARGDIELGDDVHVLPGDIVPIDGLVTEGLSHVDESSLTGESRPRAVDLDQTVLAGSINLEGSLWIRAGSVPTETVLAQMERCLAEARMRQPSIQRLADRVATVFVPAVLALAVTVFMYWTNRGGFTVGLMNALSVLLISCPCALGLAAPLACWGALRRAASLGILVDSPATLERAAAVHHVLMDKTGTLTQPRWMLDRIEAAPGIDARQALEWAASLESTSPHPLARSLLAEAEQRGITPRFPKMAANIPGCGIEAHLDGRRLRLGSPLWLAQGELFQGELVQEKETADLVLADEGGILAQFHLEETLRPDAKSTVETLIEHGFSLGLLSGDRMAATLRVTRQLGIPGQGQMLPADKVRRLTELRRSRGQAVAMVGDGLNDAAVLAAADVGIALGSASDLAQRCGNVRLISDRLDRIPLFFALARETRGRIRANLAWAFGFNTVGLALAACGLLTPVFAAAAMAASSLVVVWRGAGHA